MTNCPYCGNPAQFVTGEVIYPHRKDLHDKKFYACPPCDAYVGCHIPNRYTLKIIGHLGDSLIVSYEPQR